MVVGEAVYPCSCFHASAYVSYYASMRYGIHITKNSAHFFHLAEFSYGAGKWLAFTYQNATKSFRVRTAQGGSETVRTADPHQGMWASRSHCLTASLAVSVGHRWLAPGMV